MTVRAKRQTGFTLVELVMTMGVTAIIVVAASYGILQVLNMNTRNTNYMSAVRYAQTAGYWVTRDVEMASADNVTIPSSGRELRLGWRSDPETWHTTRYWFVGNTLWREEDGRSSPIAEHLSIGQFAPVDSAGSTVNRVTFTVTATVESRGFTGQETRLYEANPRSRLGE